MTRLFDMADGRNENVKTVISNIAEVTADRKRLNEKLPAHLEELCLCLCELADDDEIFFRDRSFIETYRSITGHGGDARILFVSKTERVISVCERAFLCKKITNRLGIVGFDGLTTFEDEDDMADDGRVYYIRSPYSDDAFLRFSPYIESPKAIYGNSFGSVCEEVSEGLYGYCMLPIKNSTDKELSSFIGLIKKYGLKIVLTCEIKTGEDETTVFALLKKNLVYIKNGRISVSVSVKTDRLSDLIVAADALDTGVSFIHGSDDGIYDLTFECQNETVCGFLAFLYLEYDKISVNGIYTEAD